MVRKKGKEKKMDGKRNKFNDVKKKKRKSRFFGGERKKTVVAD